MKKIIKILRKIKSPQNFPTPTPTRFQLRKKSFVRGKKKQQKLSVLLWNGQYMKNGSCEMSWVVKWVGWSCKVSWVVRWKLLYENCKMDVVKLKVVLWAMTVTKNVEFFTVSTVKLYRTIYCGLLSPTHASEPSCANEFTIVWVGRKSVTNEEDSELVSNFVQIVWRGQGRFLDFNWRRSMEFFKI